MGRQTASVGKPRGQFDEILVVGRTQRGGRGRDSAGSVKRVAPAAGLRSEWPAGKLRLKPPPALLMNAYTRARELIDAAHAADPTVDPDGQPAELVYAGQIEAWVAKLVPAASPLLRLAARCQHLERWSVPRATFPEGKAGYLAWRRSLYVKQAARAKELLLLAGVAPAEADEAATWVSKTGLKSNPGTQALEDAAVLVFLESEISAFAAQHAEYPREKFIDILRKSWRKLSPHAQALAGTLTLPPDIAALVREATAS
jgi:tRNAThr (cytosine32-N3)-methyltransferase